MAGWEYNLINYTSKNEILDVLNVNNPRYL